VLYPLCDDSQQVCDDQWSPKFLDMLCLHVYTLNALLKFESFEGYKSQETKNTSFNAYANL
jgi:hypothetical protein